MMKQRINLSMVLTKAKSKSEMYRLLTVKAGMYLSSKDETKWSSSATYDSDRRKLISLFAD